VQKWSKQPRRYITWSSAAAASADGEEHAGAHGHRLQRLHHCEVVVRGLAPHRIPGLFAVAQHGPAQLI